VAAQCTEVWTFPLSATSNLNRWAAVLVKERKDTMGRCPKCGSSQIEQYRMPYGPIWCRDCGFRVEDKTATPNPFIEVTNTESASASDNEESSKRSLGAALYEFFQPKQKERSVKKSETKKNSSKESKLAND
jgi:transcription initiation factor TFIIIB Brf1 subunit/transcription initiation factor TFIIB